MLCAKACHFIIRTILAINRKLKPSMKGSVVSHIHAKGSLVLSVKQWPLIVGCPYRMGVCVADFFHEQPHNIGSLALTLHLGTHWARNNKKWPLFKHDLTSGLTHVTVFYVPVTTFEFCTISITTWDVIFQSHHDLKALILLWWASEVQFVSFHGKNVFLQQEILRA